MKKREDPQAKAKISVPLIWMVQRIREQEQLLRSPENLAKVFSHHQSRIYPKTYNRQTESRKKTTRSHLTCKKRYVEAPK